MDEPTQAFASPDLAKRIRADGVWAMTRCGWSEAERAVRPMRVVVLDVDAQDVFELSAACDQEPVEAVAADCSDPAFGECVELKEPRAAGLGLLRLSIGCRPAFLRRWRLLNTVPLTGSPQWDSSGTSSRAGSSSHRRKGSS